MSKACSKLTSELKNLKVLQGQLNESLDSYFAGKKNPDQARTEEITSLIAFFQIRKEIQESYFFRKWRTEKFVATLLEKPLWFTLEKKEIDVILDLLREKMDNDELLTRKELLFVYEPKELIKYFDDDVREQILALRKARNLNDDLPVIFNCAPSLIVHNQKELIEANVNKSKASVYSGKLFEGIFDLLPDSINRIYTDYPEGEIKRKQINLGTGLKTFDEFENAFKPAGFVAMADVKEMMSSPMFNVADKAVVQKLVVLPTSTLSTKVRPSENDIRSAALKLGLKPCPAEVGPQLRLQYSYYEQMIGKLVKVIMKDPIDIPHSGGPRQFVLGNDGQGVWLGTINKLNSPSVVGQDDLFVFCYD